MYFILQDFTSICRTILHDSAPSREFRHSEVNSKSNIYYKLKNDIGYCSNPLASPVAGTDPDPASILSRSDLYLIV